MFDVCSLLNSPTLWGTIAAWEVICFLEIAIPVRQVLNLPSFEDVWVIVLVY